MPYGHCGCYGSLMIASYLTRKTRACSNSFGSIIIVEEVKR